MSSKDTTKPEAVKSDGQDQHGKKNGFKKPYNGNRTTSKFEGRCDELKGHIYDYGESKNADQMMMKMMMKMIIGPRVLWCKALQPFKDRRPMGFQT
jgi:hypothetical protein